MPKSRSFSIYLLKQGYDSTNALRDDHLLADNVLAQRLPPESSLYILDSEPKPPWWKFYFDIPKSLLQENKGALVFVNVNDRCFALSFGHVAHNLLDHSYEYDFGLRVTLNSVDPLKLKSTDVLEPGAAKRQRTQMPVESELTLFDFDRDSNILRRLTGKVREEYNDLFRNATGASNLRINTGKGPAELPDLCKKLLDLYEDDSYKSSFPDIQNIVPVRDPAILDKLNSRVLASIREQSLDVNLAVPEILNYDDTLYAIFTGAGTSLRYEDVYIGNYYSYLSSRGCSITELSIEDLKRHQLVLADENGAKPPGYTIYKSLIFDTDLNDTTSETFHLCEGNWYKVENSYIQRLNTYLDPLFLTGDLPSYSHASEGEYNNAVAAEDGAIACLDRENITPHGQSQIEPCDLIALRADIATLYHIKVSTLSAQLSHLFNQGVNSVELLRLEPQAIDILVELIRKHMVSGAAEPLVTSVRNKMFHIVFGIVTRKDPTQKSLNLPLFSRISLMRAMKSLQLMNVRGGVMFIEDQNVTTAGTKRPRKRKHAPDPILENGGE